ncbi:MAG: 30S ribosomal protein S8e [Candidatus Altiarchaeota archaeon]
MYHGKVTKARKKRKIHTGRVFSETQIQEKKQKKLKTKGGGEKIKLLAGNKVNVVIDGKNVSCDVTGLEDNPANRDYTRRKIITKGALLSAKTPDGKEIKVKVTSRPGQDGVINAITA